MVSAENKDKEAAKKYVYLSLSPPFPPPFCRVCRSLSPFFSPSPVRARALCACIVIRKDTGKRDLLAWQKRPTSNPKDAGTKACEVDARPHAHAPAFWLRVHCVSCLAWQKRPTCTAKKTYLYGKRDLLVWQKRPTCMAKETYLYGKRDLLVWQKRGASCLTWQTRPTCIAKREGRREMATAAYFHGKRDLLVCPKRPMCSAKRGEREI